MKQITLSTDQGDNIRTLVVEDTAFPDFGLSGIELEKYGNTILIAANGKPIPLSDS